MINECINKKLKFIFRIKESMFKEMFFMKNFNNDKSCIVYYKGLKLRIVKYFINNKPYYNCTNIFSSTIDYIKLLYHKRWKIEEFFKTYKIFCNGKKWKTNNINLINQEIFIRIINITLASIIKKELLNTNNNYQLFLYIKVLLKWYMNFSYYYINDFLYINNMYYTIPD